MPQPSPTTLAPRDFALSIVRTLRDNGHTAYFAGGCVRDELFGLAPKDFDVATDATPQRIASLFPSTQEVGAQFGVMIVKSRGQMVEVATFRADGEYTDRRRPDAVTFSDPKTDAHRRDFTINALFLDPLASTGFIAINGITPKGQLIDYVNGVQDVQNKILRAVGDPDLRFKEDDLRILRAIRFAARFNLAIDPATSEAIRRHAGELSGISRERIGEELRKMLLHPTRAAAATLLATHALIGPCLGGVLDLANHARQDFPILAATNSPKFGVYLAALLCDLGLSDHYRDLLAPRPRPDHYPQAYIANRLRQALMLSNDELHDFQFAIEGSTALTHAWPALATAPRKRLAQNAWFSDALALLKARNPAAASQVETDLSHLATTPGGISPHPFITGDDLNSLGLVPGPRFKKILDQVYDAQLSGEITSRTQALELVRRLSV